MGKKDISQLESPWQIWSKIFAPIYEIQAILVISKKTYTLGRQHIFFLNRVALWYMNPDWVQITDLKHFWKILIHQNLQGRSLFYRDFWELWSVTNADSCIKRPQDSKKTLKLLDITTFRFCQIFIFLYDSIYQQVYDYYKKVPIFRVDKYYISLTFVE